MVYFLDGLFSWCISNQIFDKANMLMINFFKAQSKPMAAGGWYCISGSKVVLGAMIFNVGQYRLKRWRVTFAFQTKCMCNVPVVNAGYQFRRHTDSSWLCLWPWAFLGILSWPPTKASGQVCSQRHHDLLSLKTKHTHTHTHPICELALKMLYVDFVLSSWFRVWITAFQDKCLHSL